MAEASFRVSKLDLLISLTVAHIGVSVANPVLIPENEFVTRGLWSVGFVIVSVIGLALWNSRTKVQK